MSHTFWVQNLSQLTLFFFFGGGVKFSWQDLLRVTLTLRNSGTRIAHTVKCHSLLSGYLKSQHICKTCNMESKKIISFLLLVLFMYSFAHLPQICSPEYPVLPAARICEILTENWPGTTPNPRPSQLSKKRRWWWWIKWKYWFSHRQMIPASPSLLWLRWIWWQLQWLHRPQPSASFPQLQQMLIFSSLTTRYIFNFVEVQKISQELQMPLCVTLN